MQLNGISFTQKLHLKWKGIRDFQTPLPKNYALNESSSNQIAYSELKVPLVKKAKIKDWVNKAGARKFTWYLDL